MEITSIPHLHHDFRELGVIHVCLDLCRDGIIYSRTRIGYDLVENCITGRRHAACRNVTAKSSR